VEYRIYSIPEAVSFEKFDEFVMWIISMFSDDFVLGISDGLPPADDGRVRRVSKIIKHMCRR